jgi:thiamine-phosphate diphosphorylase
VTALPVPSLHLVTSRQRLSPHARTISAEIAALERLLDEAIDAGVDVVQVRERDVGAGLLHAFVSRVVVRAASTRTQVLVNERADVALAAGAAGVHLPSAGLPADRVRSMDRAWIIGRSIHGGDEPRDRGACDYLLFGTVFTSESKPQDSPVAGLDALRAMTRTAGRPVVAIGGLTPHRARACLEAGAAGVAAIGAFLPRGRARDAMGTRHAALAFRDAIDDWTAAAGTPASTP